jgi:ketosteroid isomerase-like protein
MPTHDNLATVRGSYEAFGTGDVETILDAVADDVDWAVDAEPVASWHGQRNGKDGVASTTSVSTAMARSTTTAARRTRHR